MAASRMLLHFPTHFAALTLNFRTPPDDRGTRRENVVFRRVRLVRSQEHDPWKNLALEEFLLGDCSDGEGILYLWQNARTVVIGRNQNAWAECRLDLLEAEGGRLARRTSGGGAVYHDLGNLNYSFILPRKFYSMERQLGTVLHALGSLGIHGEFSGRNDLVVSGRKFSGNAYQLTRFRSLHHGTLLLSADMDMLSRYLNVDPEKLKSKGVSSVSSRVINLRDVAPALEIEALRNAMEEAFLEGYVHEEAVREQGFPDSSEFRTLFEKHSSAEWRFGRSPKCEVCVSRRFSWGGVELRINTEGDRISGPVIYSDAMDVEMIASLAGVLNGIPLNWNEMANAVREGFPESPEMENVADWLEEAPIGRKEEVRE